MTQYKRILLKLSGESLMGGKSYGIDETRLSEYAAQIKEIADMGIQVGIVIGGGNIFRGLSGASKGFDRVKGDQMGMLATVINSLALSSALVSMGAKANVLTAIRWNLSVSSITNGEPSSCWKMDTSLLCPPEQEIHSSPPIPARRYEVLKLKPM
jgi:uridylate kinase (EC 2.7.4.22)